MPGDFLVARPRGHFDDSICQFYIALDKLPTLLDSFDMDLNKDARWFGQLVINDESLYEPNWYKVRHLHEVPDYLCCGGGAAFSTFDSFYAELEYSDVKTMKALPGKGLVPFVLKAFR